ncbi:hypothetical protein ABIE44_000154 [Marmoricola sp. OAE513]|uniref:hypothetical protein n=1 Tax=Marmoricola sp. OAE513 TaxID=2817894 RepID=UPI001AE112AA
MFAPRSEPAPVPRSIPIGGAPVAPPGWPSQVRPPDSPEWERTATNWLLDICPPEYRDYPGLRRHPAILARFAVLHVEAGQAAVQRGLSEVRGLLRDIASHAEVAAAVDVWQSEGARLIATRRAVGLVEDALRGQRYAARMAARTA